MATAAALGWSDSPIADFQMRIFVVSALLLLAAACARSPSEPDIRTASAPMIASAAAQVRRCYRAPRVSHSVRQIATTLRVRITESGYPDGLPVVVAQHGVTPANRAFADRMAEAAIGAVMRCSPLRLPPEMYQQGWRVFDLTFSPRQSA